MANIDKNSLINLFYFQHLLQNEVTFALVLMHRSCAILKLYTIDSTIFFLLGGQSFILVRHVPDVQPVCSLHLKKKEKIYN